MRVKDVKNKNTYKVKIVPGNCLAVWITETETEYNLWFCSSARGPTSSQSN